jgi:hypothetical protein
MQAGSMKSHEKQRASSAELACMHRFLAGTVLSANVFVV